MSQKQVLFFTCLSMDLKQDAKRSQLPAGERRELPWGESTPGPHCTPAGWPGRYANAWAAPWSSVRQALRKVN